MTSKQRLTMQERLALAIARGSSPTDLRREKSPAPAASPTGTSSPRSSLALERNETSTLEVVNTNQPDPNNHEKQPSSNSQDVTKVEPGLEPQVDGQETDEPANAPTDNEPVPEGLQREPFIQKEVNNTIGNCPPVLPPQTFEEAAENPTMSLDEADELRLKISHQAEQVQCLLDENTNLRNELETARNTKSDETPKGSADSELSQWKRLVVEKEEKITLLLEEGQKLSLQELKYMNTIKRLRVKSTEDQKSIEDINKKLSKIEKDNADSQEKIKKLVETDRRQKEQIKSLSKLQIERNAALTSVSQLQSQLTELSARMEKNIENALQESSDREQRAQKELQDTIGRLRTESDNVQAQTMNELRRVTSELERSIATELELRREISDLENQLEIQRYRAEETSERYLNAGQNELTHKLESTRNQYSQSSLKWQQTEARLNALYDQLRLEKVDLELQKTQAWDKLRDMTDKVTITSDAQCRAETSLENLRKEYEIVTDSNRMKDDEISHLLTKIENLEQNLTQISTSSDHSAPHLSIERCNSISPPDEMSMKNSKEFPLPRIDSSSAIPDILEEHQVMSPDRRPSKMTFETYGPGTSIPPQDTISVQTANAGSVSIGIIERMSTAMRKLEGDLALSRQEILRLSSQRDEVRAACLELSKELEIRKSIEKKNIELQKQVFGLEERFHATLELLGEKSETIEEMQQDIIDLKAMYKEQIQELVEQIAT